MLSAVDIINSNIDVRKILNHYEFNNITGGSLIRACCKIHEGNNPTSFVINEESGLWYCHTNCGGGDVFTLSQKIDKVPFAKSVEIIAGILGINISGMEIIEYKPQYIKDTKEWLKFMKRKKPTIMEYNISAKTTNVTKFRNFHPDTLSKFQLQYVKEFFIKSKEKEYFLYNRLLIPITFNNTQIGVLLRRLKSSDVPKWSNQPEGIETGNILYNYDEAKNYNTIIVVEGIFDVWRYYEAGFPNTVATFGAKMSNEQEKLLLKTGADLILSYDGDETGIKATNKAIEKLRYKANLKIMTIPNDQDPCSLSHQEIKDLMNNLQKIYEWER